MISWLLLVLRPTDRVMWIWLARHWGQWRYALVLIQPATVLRWHREGYRSALDLWLGEVLCIKGIPIPYGAPNAAAHIERFMGSLKRECLNHFIFLSEDYLRRTVLAYITYYNESRPHQGIDGIPEFGAGSPRATPQKSGDNLIKIIAHPVLGGLHHDYRLAA